MNISLFFEQLETLFAEGKRDQVLSFLQQQLGQARLEGDDPSELFVLQEISSYYEIEGEHELCALCAEIAAQKMKKIGLEQSSSYCATLLNAALGYHLSDNIMRAQQLLDAAMHLSESELYREQPLLPEQRKRVESSHPIGFGGPFFAHTPSAIRIYESALAETTTAFSQKSHYFTICRHCAEAYEAQGDLGKSSYYHGLADSFFSNRGR